MFGINSLKSNWEKLACRCGDDYFREGIRTLFIPYKVSPKKFIINIDCMKTGNSYSYNYYTGCTPSMCEWCTMPFWNRPIGFPEWFLAAFPDVALWLQNQDGKNYLHLNFENMPESEMLDRNVGTFKISFLKILIDAYISRDRLPLETIG